jgi:hypothetical protein
MKRKLTELESAVYETPDGRHCVLVLEQSSVNRDVRPNLLRGDGTVRICYLVDGRVPPLGRMEFDYRRHDELHRVGALVDAP